VFRRIPAPDARALAALACSALAGALGALPGSAGAGDPVALLAWLTFLAPGAGLLCAAHGARFLPFAVAVPGSWCLALVALQASAPRAPGSPLWAAAALFGLFGLGYALGRRTQHPARNAGLLLLAVLGLSCASVGFGVLAPGAALARAHPEWARWLLDLSPLVLVFDGAGLDWPHAHPTVYAESGVEWFQRHPWPDQLAGPALLVVGCCLALAVPARRPPSSEG